MPRCDHGTIYTICLPHAHPHLHMTGDGLIIIIVGYDWFIAIICFLNLLWAVWCRSHLLCIKKNIALIMGTKGNALHGVIYLPPFYIYTIPAAFSCISLFIYWMLDKKWPICVDCKYFYQRMTIFFYFFCLLVCFFHYYWAEERPKWNENLQNFIYEGWTVSQWWQLQHWLAKWTQSIQMALNSTRSGFTPFNPWRLMWPCNISQSSIRGCGIRSTDNAAVIGCHDSVVLDVQNILRSNLRIKVTGNFSFQFHFCPLPVLLKLKLIILENSQNYAVFSPRIITIGKHVRTPGKWLR